MFISLPISKNLINKLIIKITIRSRVYLSLGLHKKTSISINNLRAVAGAGLRRIRSLKSPHSLRHCSSSYLTRSSLSKPLSASNKSTFSRQVVLFELLILIKFVKIFSGNLLCVLEVLSLLGIWFTLEMAQSQRTLGTSFVEQLFHYNHVSG